MADRDHGWWTIVAALGGSVSMTLGIWLNTLVTRRKERRETRNADLRDAPHRSADERRADTDGFDRLIGRYAQRVDDLESRCKGLEEQMDERDRLHREWIATMRADHDREIAALDIHISTTTSALHELTSKAADLQRENVMLQASKSRQELTIRAQQQEIDALREQVRALERRNV